MRAPPQRERAGDADALALPAGKAVRVAPQIAHIEPDEVDKFGDHIVA